MVNAKRVRWLERAYKALRLELIPSAPAKACVSVSVTTRKKAIGEWHRNYKGPDGTSFIAIHPRIFTDPIEVLATELHEMIHATTPKEAKPHGKPFQILAKAVGLEPPWTATSPGKVLRGKLEKLAQVLGKLPPASWQSDNILVPLPVFEIACSCPRAIEVTEEFLKEGNVRCLKCKKLFRRKKPAQGG